MIKYFAQHRIQFYLTWAIPAMLMQASIFLLQTFNSTLNSKFGILSIISMLLGIAIFALLYKIIPKIDKQ